MFTYVYFNAYHFTVLSPILYNVYMSVPLNPNLTPMFQAESPALTQTWFQTLQLYSRSLGGWRRRRRGLGNIMVDPGTH